MSARHTTRIAVAAVTGLVVTVAVGRVVSLGSVPPIRQPMAFSHATHVGGQKLECQDCHAGARREARAGLPDIRSCADCHQKAKGSHPDEPLVREYARRGAQIPWVQVNRNAGHVYFSHRAHVTAAKMKCEECHGSVGERKTPPERPVPSLHSMSACMDCHFERQASVECIACHK